MYTYKTQTGKTLYLHKKLGTRLGGVVYYFSYDPREAIDLPEGYEVKVCGNRPHLQRISKMSIRQYDNAKAKKPKTDKEESRIWKLIKSL